MWSLVVTVSADLLTESMVWSDWMECWSDHSQSLYSVWYYAVYTR